MSTHANSIRLLLSAGPMQATSLTQKLGVSQPTLSRAIHSLGDDIVRIGSGRSTQYALRDRSRGLGEIPVHRVDEDGKLKQLGVLVPVRNEGFVMLQAQGASIYSEGLPWWLLDMRPQGFMGRAYAAQYATSLGLPSSVREWSDTQALRALLAHGHDAVGNILLGNIARERFLNAPASTPVSLADKARVYPRLAEQVAREGETFSSAAGEQPKFATYADTSHGPAHLIVKFTLPDANAITERWRDLLLSEHLALQTLHDHGVPAAQSEVYDCEGRRFLEVERFDRIGVSGRRALYSLTSVDAEFAGMAHAPWLQVTKALARKGVITPQASASAALLYAYGTLIGNTDMHQGNLSFMGADGRPYALAPAYDMLPMGFQPRASGEMQDTLASISLHPDVEPAHWIKALALAQTYLARICSETRFSARFAPCIVSLAQHIQHASDKIARLAT